MKMTELVVASKNPKKRAEMQAILSDLPLSVLSIDEVCPQLATPFESGTSFHENSALKALYFAAACGRLTVADDSGLEVDALAGAPGVYSSSYGGEEGNDARNNATLMHNLRHVATKDRVAQFHCVITLAFAKQIVWVTEGICRGMILHEPRGQSGFGYDPYFYFPDFGKTFAELTRDEKARVSHRGIALTALKAALPTLLSRFDQAEAF